MSFTVAITLSILTFVLWQSISRALAKPNPPRWLSESSCFLFVAPALTGLIAFTTVEFAVLGFENPTLTALVVGGLLIAAVVLSFVGRVAPANAAA